jgi:hypothetical protein
VREVLNSANDRGDATSARPRVTRLLPHPRDLPLAILAGTHPPPNDTSRKTIVHQTRSPRATALGKCNIGTFGPLTFACVARLPVGMNAACYVSARPAMGDGIDLMVVFAI